jgi:hypothetical protein
VPVLQILLRTAETDCNDCAFVDEVGGVGAEDEADRGQVPSAVGVICAVARAAQAELKNDDYDYPTVIIFELLEVRQDHLVESFHYV